MSADSSPISTDIDFDADGRQVSYLRAPHSHNTSGWGNLLIPITVVKNGIGPTVLFTGGVHGDEYEGPVALMKLSRQLGPAEVQGRVIIIPTLNLPATRAGTRLSPIDDKDLNRVFPGHPRGTMTEVIAHYVRQEILPLCDAVIDLHSGGYSMDFVPYISMHYLEDEVQYEQTRAALEAFQAPVALIINELSGEGLLDYEVERAGKIFLCAEMGGAGMLSLPALRVAETGVRNILKYFGITEGEVVTRESQDNPASRLMEVPDAGYYHMAESAGIYESFYELGQPVEAGQPLGQVHFYENLQRDPEQIIAKQSGMLIITRGPGWVDRGDTVAVLARNFATRPTELRGS